MTAVEWLLAVLIIATLTYISVYGAHMEIVDKPALFAGDIDRVHAQVITGNAESPTQYRIGSYLMAHYLSRMFHGETRLFQTYLFLRFIFTFGSGILLYAFLRRYLAPEWAFGGTAYFYALLPWAYLGYHHQPADPVNLFMFLLGYHAVCSGKSWWMLVIVTVGMINRETVILLPLFDILMNYRTKSPGSLLMRAALSVVAGLFVYFLIFNAFGPREHPDPYIMLYSNLHDPLLPLSFGVFLLPLLLISFAGWRHLDSMHHRMLVFSGVVIIFYFVFGNFHEMRLFLPILPLLVLTTAESLKGLLSKRCSAPG